MRWPGLRVQRVGEVVYGLAWGQSFSWPMNSQFTLSNLSTTFQSNLCR